METRSKKRKNSGSNGESGKKIKEESQTLLVRQETKIMDLPDEILLEIMSYLTTNDVVENLAKVSTKFKQLSEDEILIEKIKLNDEEEEEEEAEEEEEDDEDYGYDLEDEFYGYDWDDEDYGCRTNSGCRGCYARAFLGHCTCSGSEEDDDEWSSD